MENFDVVLGEVETWGGRKIGLFREDRRRHCYMNGQTGCGKSTLMHSMIVQDIHNGEGVVVMDPHGPLADQVLASIPKHRIKDVIVVDPSDTSRPVGINPLYGSAKLSPEERERKAARIHSALKGVYGDTWGAELDRVLMASLLALMDAPDLHPTLLSVLQLIDDKNYRKKVKPYIRNRATWLYFNNTLENYRSSELAQKTSSTSNKFFQLVASTQLANVFGQYVPSFDFREIMDTRKILIIRIPQSKLGEIYCSLFGAIMASELFQSAIERGVAQEPDLNERDVTEYEIADCYFYIDEFHKIRSTAIDGIFAEARKYRLNLIIAHQYLKQMDGNTEAAVFGNAGTSICFRTSPKDAETISDYLGELNAQAFTNLANGEVVAQCLINGEPHSPVLTKTYMFSKYSNRRAELIRNVSSYKYGRTREKVEQRIDRELGIRQPAKKTKKDKKPEKISKQERNVTAAEIRERVKALSKKMGVQWNSESN